MSRLGEAGYDNCSNEPEYSFNMCMELCKAQYVRGICGCKTYLPTGTLMWTPCKDVFLVITELKKKWTMHLKLGLFIKFIGCLVSIHYVYILIFWYTLHYFDIFFIFYIKHSPVIMLIMMKISACNGGIQWKLTICIFNVQVFMIGY